MPKARDNYQVQGNTVEELRRDLNFKLQRLADRIDKMEGIRGTSSIESDLDMNQNRLREVGPGADNDDGARLDDLLSNSPTFADLTLNGDLDAEGDIFVRDADGNLIHSLE